MAKKLQNTVFSEIRGVFFGCMMGIYMVHSADNADRMRKIVPAGENFAASV